MIVKVIALRNDVVRVVEYRELVSNLLSSSHSERSQLGAWFLYVHTGLFKKEARMAWLLDKIR